MDRPISATRERTVKITERDVQIVVGYTSPYVPPDWISAHGLRPFRHQPAGRGNPGFHTSAGICPFASAVREEALELRSVTAWVIASVCDQMRRTAELLEDEICVPVFHLHVPRKWQTPAGHSLYREELRRMGRFFEQEGGVPPSLDDLSRAMHEFDDRRRLLRDLRPTLAARVFAEAVRDACETGVRPAISQAQRRNSGVPVAVVGGPLTKRELRLLDLLERAGAQVVLDGTETGERGLPRPYDRRALSEDPFGELADAHFNIPDISRRPNTEFFTWLRDSLKSRGAQGLVLVRPVWCDLWHAEVRRIRDWAPVPILDLDLSGGPTERDGRILTRIEAFMESLK